MKISCELTKFNEQWGWWCLEKCLSSFHLTEHLYPWYLTCPVQFPFRHWRRFEGSGGNLKNNFFSSASLFLSTFHIPGTWRRTGGSRCGIGDVVPTPEQLWGGQWSTTCPLGTSQTSHSCPLAAPNPNKAHHTPIVCQKHLPWAAWCWLVRDSCSPPSPGTISGRGPLKIISPSEREGEGWGQALVQGTKCLDPAKFKGSLPPTPRRDVAGQRMAGGHTDGEGM